MPATQTQIRASFTDVTNAVIMEAALPSSDKPLVRRVSEKLEAMGWTLDMYRKVHEMVFKAILGS